VDQAREVGRAGTELLAQGLDIAVTRVGVERLEEWLVRQSERSRFVAMSDEHLSAAGRGDRRELLAKCCLANARLTSQQDETALSPGSSVKRRPELSQFGTTANEWRPLRYPLPGLLPPGDQTRTRRSVAR
jgi:hypothetical protein